MFRTRMRVELTHLRVESSLMRVELTRSMLPTHNATQIVDSTRMRMIVFLNDRRYFPSA
jgi:hypothetical protein